MALADFSLILEEAPSDGGKKARSGPVLRLSGDWTVTGIAGVASRLKAALRDQPSLELDTKDLIRLDTAGAYVIASAVGERIKGKPFARQPDFSRLYHLVTRPAMAVDESLAEQEKTKTDWLHPHISGLTDLGRVTVDIFADLRLLAIFVGHMMTSLGLAIIDPRRIRWAALISQMQRAGLEAIPIVGVTTFFVGAVIAFLGIEQLQLFGASIFAIELLGISVVREFGPIIAAVLLAGRSSSSFAAEVGAMKMNQEIDAMKVLGIDPFDALVLPRVIGMIIMTPLISFIGAVAGLFAGIVVIWAVLGYPPSFFIERYYNYVGFVNFFVGMIKTPIFAATVAVIGCYNGMAVKDDVISLGKQVTKSVVQAIFTIIMIDAFIAIMFNGFDFQ